ncbi:DUF6350 family protein [Corynebacterium sp. 153RC1]|uniref:cell division protein PerM n=1 Tax=unclassified Corynebacterium TaxID=2624378 RepID=UPI00211C674C|nr:MULTISPECIES: DUF6350 family protein [unclassified Corynebacterium]MCQ9353490.1 DUF6350 family protein [Corynebacterium sp. 209RC1]MCQ9355726.1 DUF6350 family protein [Corynebacterium sp. 1222RC1]MCQ9357894.1 DUF6350 family protein [Corynebacterium sp. 122RC1]MCQ9360090.1 DUF6350 family protein [Corynebacterium sp. 142RC1]MCQ9362231.1 DUF6350 family protein [Corynebacterium sp. 153RC1]
MSSQRTRRPRTRPAGAVPEGKSRPVAVVRKQEPQAPEPQPVEALPTLRTRLRRFAPVVLLNNALILLLSIAFALIALMSTATSMAALAAGTAEAWMVFQLIDVHGRGQQIGVLPMLPALLMVWGFSRRIYRAVKERVSLADLAVLAVLTLGVPLIVTLVMWGMLLDASVVYDLTEPHLGRAIGMTLLLHATVLIAGMGVRLWKALARKFGVALWIIDAAKAAAISVGLLLAVSLAVYAVSLAVHWQQVQASTSTFTQWGTAGAWGLSVLYLPNVAVGALAVLFGSEVYLGAGGVSLFGVNMVNLPPLPILAGIPSSAAAWAPALLVVVLGVLVWRVYRAGGSGEAGEVGKHWGFLGSLTQAGIAALIMLLLVIAAGGNLGVYGEFGPNLWLTPLFAFVWVGYVLAAAAGVRMLQQRGRGDRRGENESLAAEDTVVAPAEEAAQAAVEPEVEDGAETAAESAEIADAAETVAVEAEGPVEADEPEEADDADGADEADEADEAEGTDGAEDPEDPEDSDKAEEAEFEEVPETPEQPASPVESAEGQDAGDVGTLLEEAEEEPEDASENTPKEK